MAIVNNTIHPITLLMVAVLRPLAIGDIVIYRGSMRRFHGEEFVVVDVYEDGSRMRIVRRNHQGVRLMDVRRQSVFPTGEHVVVCDCGHSLDSSRNHPAERKRYCGAVGCDCTKHDPAEANAPQLGKPAELLLVEISRTARHLRQGAQYTARDIADGAIHFDGDRFVLRATAGPQLEALVSLARHFIQDCPDLGITRELLDVALTGDTSSLFRQ